MRARILKIESDPAAAVQQAVDALLNGDLVVLPTETVYGLAGMDSASALELIYLAKSRDRGKPVPLLAARPDGLERFGFSLSNCERLLAGKFWPGPLTLVLDRCGVSEGVRVPDHELVLEIIEKCGGLLRVTSANQSGEPPALDAGMAFAALADRAALILDDGGVSGGVPSTVVKCRNEGFDILREGAISHASIAEVMKGK